MSSTPTLAEFQETKAIGSRVENALAFTIRTSDLEQFNLLLATQVFLGIIWDVIEFGLKRLRVWFWDTT
jgi:hypothetical protein